MPCVPGHCPAKNEEFGRNLTNGRQQLLRKQDVTIGSNVNFDSASTNINCVTPNFDTLTGTITELNEANR